MKKLIFFAMVAAMLICLAACDKPANQVPNTNTTASNHDHAYKIIDSKAASCEEQGYVQYACSCGDTYTEHTNALGHQYSDVEGIGSSCVQQGQVIRVCACGHSYVEQTGFGDHIWSEWFVEIEPTYTTTGREKHVCFLCNESETRDLDTNTLEEELNRYATLAVLLPEFGSPAELSPGILFNWLRISADYISCQANDYTREVIMVYSLATFDEVTQRYFGQTYDFVTYAQNQEGMYIDEEKNQLTWITYGTGGWGETVLDTSTKIDDNHYSVRYYLHYGNNVPAYYGTLKLKLTDYGFLIESHTKEG